MPFAAVLGPKHERLRSYRRRVRRIPDGVTARLRASTRGRDDETTFGRIFDELGEEGLGLLLIVLTIPALVPVPGPWGVIFGAALAFVATQMVLGRSRIWLPSWLTQRPIRRRDLARVVRTVSPTLLYIEQALRPRLRLLCDGQARCWIGLPALVMAILIALPIPFGNSIPAFAVIAFALGLLARDGLAVVAGLVLATAGFAWAVMMIGSSLWIFDWIGRLIWA